MLVYAEPPPDLRKALHAICVETLARLAQHALANNVHVLVHVPPDTEIEEHPAVTYMCERCFLKKVAYLFTGATVNQRATAVVTSLPCIEDACRNLGIRKSRLLGELSFS